MKGSEAMSAANRRVLSSGMVIQSRTFMIFSGSNIGHDVSLRRDLAVQFSAFSCKSVSHVSLF